MSIERDGERLAIAKVKTCKCLLFKCLGCCVCFVYLFACGTSFARFIECVT